MMMISEVMWIKHLVKFNQKQHKNFQYICSINGISSKIWPDMNFITTSYVQYFFF